MDAARGAMGQGWPFATRPWSGDGASEPEAKRRAGWRGKTFWFLLGDCQKGPAQQGGTNANPKCSNGQRHGIATQQTKELKRPLPNPLP